MGIVCVMAGHGHNQDNLLSLWVIYEKRCSNSRNANLGLFLNWGGVYGGGGDRGKFLLKKEFD